MDGQHVEVRCKGCKNWFCKTCCVKKGKRLATRLLEVLETFDGMQLWTLTVNPHLFVSPESAYRYLRGRRGISEWVRTLKRQGHLAKSARWFYVVEFHKSGWPHFHIILETRFIDHAWAHAAWAKNVPAGERVEHKAGFGYVSFSKAKRFHGPTHAKNYLAKYLTKTPEDGFPAWAMRFKGQMHRYSTCRRFWPVKEKQEQEWSGPQVHQVVEHRGDCFCEECRGQPKPKKAATIAERVSRCGWMGSLFQVKEEPAMGRVRKVFTWLCDTTKPYADFVGEFGLDPEARSYSLSAQMACDMMQACRGQKEALRGVYEQRERYDKAWERLYEHCGVKGGAT